MSKTLYTTVLLALAAVTQLPSPSAAQSGDLLIVEKRKDLAARTRLLIELRKTIVTVNFEDASAKDLVDYLHSATGKRVNFILSGKSDDFPRVSLELAKVRLPNLMAVIEEKTDLRFTFRGGLVFLKPKDKVKEFTYLQMYDVRVAVMPVRNFKPPRLGLGLGELEDEGDDDEEGQPLLFSGDRIVDLLRSNAVPDTWDTEGVSLEFIRGVLLVRQSVRGHKAVRGMLEKLGAIPPTRRIMRRRSPRLGAKARSRLIAAEMAKRAKRAKAAAKAKKTKKVEKPVPAKRTRK